MKGLRLDVFTNPLYKGCALGGVSDRRSQVTLVGEGIPAIFEATDDAPAVRLVKREIGGEVVVHAEPVQAEGERRRHWMAGGAYVATSDSRFSEALRRLGHSGYCAINLHDRHET